MKESKGNIGELFQKYHQGCASDAEKSRLFAYFSSEAGKAELEGELRKAMEEAPPAGWEREQDVQNVLARVRENLNTRLSSEPVYESEARVRKLRWTPYAAAAAVFIAIGWFLFSDLRQQPPENRLAAMEILPGGNRATLTLADGRTISLSEAQQGIVVGNELSYTDGSEVLDKDTRNKEQRYDRPSGTENGSLTTNYYVLTTPKGGTYQVTLPDGSNVWLNAASMLKYPSRFTEDERVVELEGEAYFDVNEQTRSLTSSQKTPFKVITNGQTVEVLGTEFNISAYADDPETTTTLVEGKVKVSASNRQGGLTANDLRPTANVLTPGYQAITRDAHTETHQVDVQQYTAWKEGKFIFEQEPLESIMKKLSRWYDIEVVYTGDKTYSTFTGSISRLEHIGAILEKIRFTQAVDFKIEGRRVTVM